METVLITGASVGIGRETAFFFAEAGYNLILTFNKSSKEAQEVKKKCEAEGATVLLLPLDISTEESIKKCLQEALKKHKTIDILINNAGIIVWKNLKDQSLQEIEDQLRTNLEGLIKLTKLFLPHVKKSIVNIASGAGKTGYDTLTTYCATKFGVRGFTQALAEELPLLKIYVVNPGMTATRMNNFEGVDPKKVAQIIFRTATDYYKKPSGADIDVWDYL